MKTLAHTLYAISALFLSVTFSGCHKSNDEIVYQPRLLKVNEDFNDPTTEQNLLTVLKLGDGKSAEGEAQEQFEVTYSNSTVSIQTNAADKTSGKSTFAFAKFVNTQKTCLLVQIADNSGLVAPFYLIAIKKGKLDVVSLYRPSAGAQDMQFTRGLTRISNSGYLINNDFIVTNVNAKVYFVRRPEPEKRIQGEFLVCSPDKKTLVFLIASSFYQLHYPSDDTLSETIDSKLSTDPASVYRLIQQKYRWEKDKTGIAFLRANENDDRIIDAGDLGS